MWTIPDFQRIYTRYQESGLSAKDFCDNERITRSRFYYWQKKCSKKNIPLGIPEKHTAALHPHFIPLSVVPVNPKNHLGSPSGNDTIPPLASLIEIQYPNGTLVRFSGEKDAELIKSFIQLSR